MAALGVQAAQAIGRGGGWDAAGAININEDAKVFYLYRGVLIVLVVALPHCAVFLGLTLNQLLQKTGTIDANTFDKAVWLMCHAMNHLTSNTGVLNTAYIDNGGYNPPQNNIGFIRSFNEEDAKRGQGIHTVIAKSISRIVIRFLFAFSLNLRGMTSAPVVAAAGAAADDGLPDAADNIRLINTEIANATQVQERIGVQFDAIIIELNAQREQIEQLQPEEKNEFLLQHFAPLIAHLESLGGKFRQRLDVIQGDIQTLFGQQGAAGQAQQRISPRTFQNKTAALQSFIVRCQRDNIQQLTQELERCVQQSENEIALRELLDSAGNTFHGVTPIPGINPDQMMRIDPRFVQRLLEKALVLQANISKLLLTPVTIAYKPSIQDFLSSIGLLESAEDTGDDNDVNDNADGTVSKRLRSILEPVGAQSQCDQTIGSLRNNPGISCYICGGRPTNSGMTMECEHIFCIGLAIEYFGLLRCSGLSPEEKLFLSILYAWAHRCCNRLKSNISFMKVNPNYKAPAGAAAAAAAGRNNFFMFHDDNAAKLLGEIFNNSNQHDCRAIDKTVNKRPANKAQFVAARLPVVSANVLPLVNEANKGFGSVFAASTVLFTAMSCFKNTASLLVIQATSSRDNTSLTMNTQNMIDGFNSILPGVATVQGGGGTRKNKNKYVGGMEPRAREPVENPDYEYIKEIVLRPTIEIDELISEEQSLYEARVPSPQQISPQIHEDIGIQQISPQIHEDIGIQQIQIRADGTIDDEQKYSFLFKLTQITQSLNPLCLYGQLLLENGGENQRTNINTFGTICDKYIEHNTINGGDYTLNELSVILLCQIAIYDNDNPIDFNHVTNFDVLNYIEQKRLMRTVINDPFEQFVNGITTMYGLMSREEIDGQHVTPIRLHLQPYQYNPLRNSFMKLCLLQLNRYNECYDNASFKLNRSLISDARQIVYEFIRDELFYFYCPFIPRPDEKLLQTQRFKYCLVQHGYLDFFEFMTDYASWMFIQYDRTYFRVHNLSANPDSQEDLPLKIGDTETSFPPPPAIDNRGHRKRTITVGNPHHGGKSRKKNKHNITKKYRTKTRKSRQTRRNKHKYKHIRTIKRRKSRSRRNNSN